MPALRVLSLLPSATETVCALGARAQLVGRSHECDFPREIRSLPAVSTPRFRPDRPSDEIHRDVRALIDAALSTFAVDAEAVRRLTPDVILTQTLCEACAVTPDDLVEAVATWTGTRPEIVALAPIDLADAFTDIRRVAAALRTPEAGEALVSGCATKIARVVATVAARQRTPRVAALEWLDPPMAGGLWMPELIALAGGESPFGTPGERAPPLPLDALVAADPDLVVLAPCGFDLQRTRAEAGPLIGLLSARGLRAAREGQVYALDGNAYFNRPGPRLAESCEILAEILHPDLARFGHRRSGWLNL